MVGVWGTTLEAKSFFPARISFIMCMSMMTGTLTVLPSTRYTVTTTVKQGKIEMMVKSEQKLHTRSRQILSILSAF